MAESAPTSNGTGSRRSVPLTVALVTIGVIAIAVGIWWFGPSSAAFRYRHMTLLNLKETVEANPNDAAAWRELGLKTAQEGDATLAEPALENAMRLDHNFPDVETALGEIQLAAGDFPDAFKTLQIVTSEHPSYAAGHMAFAKFYMQKNASASAATQLEEASRLEPANADALYELAACYMELQDAAKAGKTIDSALHYSPNNPAYLALKGRLDVSLGAIPAGLDEVKRAAALAPKDIAIQALFAGLLVSYHRGPSDLDDAEQAIGRIEELNPHYPQLAFQRGEVELFRQNWPAAQRYLEAALQSRPDQDAIYFGLGQVYQRLNRPEDAAKMNDIYRSRQEIRSKIQDETALLMSHRDDPARYAALSNLQAKLGDIGGAAGTLERGIQRVPTDARLYAKLADLQMQVGDRAAVLVTLQAGLKAVPGDPRLNKWMKDFNASKQKSPQNALQGSSQQSSPPGAAQGQGSAPGSPQGAAAPAR